MARSLLVEPQPADQSDIRHATARPRTTRVLHVINGEHYSGAERVQDLLADGLPEHGFEVGLACVKPDRFPRVRNSSKVPLYEVSMRSKLDLRAVWRLLRIIRQGDYRLLHAHTPRTLLVAALASLISGVPLVYHVHSPTSRDSTHRWRNRFNALVEWLGLFVASAAIAVSQSLGEHVRRMRFIGRAVSVVPNGVPCRQRRGFGDLGISGSRESRACVCNNTQIPKSPNPQIPESLDQWTLGTVALFRPRKGIEVLLEALARLRSEGLPVRLRAVGEFETPEYEREVKDLCERLGLADAVCWTGFRQDVQSELARMDLFVLPSLFGEGLPMVVLEAMAAGVPVVGTGVEGVPEAIRDGEEGLLADPGDPVSLARAISRVVRGEVDWLALRNKALQRHAERFSDRSMAAGVAKVYRRVLSRT